MSLVHGVTKRGDDQTAGWWVERLYYARNETEQRAIELLHHVTPSVRPPATHPNLPALLVHRTPRLHPLSPRLNPCCQRYPDRPSFTGQRHKRTSPLKLVIPRHARQARPLAT